MHDANTPIHIQARTEWTRFRLNSVCVTFSLHGGTKSHYILNIAWWWHHFVKFSSFVRANGVPCCLNFHHFLETFLTKKPKTWSMIAMFSHFPAKSTFNWDYLIRCVRRKSHTVNVKAHIKCTKRIDYTTCVCISLLKETFWLWPIKPHHAN